MLTVVIISFHSSKLIEERIQEIENNIPIIIIENSRNFQLKERIEKKYRNVKIIIPSENLGWGKAVNIGIKESKTQMVFITQPDVKLIDNCINKLTECVKGFNDFTLLAPRDIAKKNFVNYELYKKYPQVYGDNLFLLKQVDYTDITWLINKEKFDDSDLWDENIFLYFEAADFAKRLLNNNKKIFIAEGIKTFHIGSASHEKSLEHYSLLNRNWHYNWSRFYYLKKHYGKFFAFKKSFNTIIKILIKLVKAIIFFKTKEKKYIYAELCGLITSMMNKRALYRPYDKINTKN